VGGNPFVVLIKKQILFHPHPFLQFFFVSFIVQERERVEKVDLKKDMKE
jgi:hypothetical protein